MGSALCSSDESSAGRLSPTRARIIPRQSEAIIQEVVRTHDNVSPGHAPVEGPHRVDRHASARGRGGVRIVSVGNTDGRARSVVNAGTGRAGAPGGSLGGPARGRARVQIVTVGGANNEGHARRVVNGGAGAPGGSLEERNLVRGRRRPPSHFARVVSEAQVPAPPAVAAETPLPRQGTACPEGDEPCVVCMQYRRSFACVPCGHMCLCRVCGQDKRLKACPICRAPFAVAMKIFA